ncbi:hypothetical protein Pint_01617 [Pistacia integerrima]|uniref:Uncharacterized protein n=2 Tax=Pistacia TaxID=55512 RepID=A0ACC1C463_9ROSI|nr:hypothetical protein Pint_01617 [Pistacia integerrima]KAJ0110499.1 hypothetical protein Patl1_01651 [Pistacia atlantica]
MGFLSDRPFKDWNDYGSTYDCSGNERKRGRTWKLDAAWKMLFKKRWPQIVHQTEPNGWEQTYWEAHLQRLVRFIINKHSIN